MNNHLVLSPHIDDEVLGCHSFLLPNTYVLYCGNDETSIKDEWVRDRPDKEVRIKECKQVARHYGFICHVHDHPVNNYTLSPLVSTFEEAINKTRPHTVLIPHPSYNQDHKMVYDAALIALRPHDLNFFVKRVLVYEQPHVYLWGHSGHDFKPNYFRQIDVEEKIKGYSIYETQVRDFRSPEQLRAIAKMRGSQANCKYAEGFQTLRWVD